MSIRYLANLLINILLEITILEQCQVNAMLIVPPTIWSTLHKCLFLLLKLLGKLWRDLLTSRLSASLAKEVQRQTESERLPECISFATAGSGKHAQGVLKRQFGTLLKSSNAEMTDVRY